MSLLLHRTSHFPIFNMNEKICGFLLQLAQQRPREDFGITPSYKINKSERRACGLCAYYITLLIRKLLFPDNLILCITKRKSCIKCPLLPRQWVVQRLANSVASNKH